MSRITTPWRHVVLINLLLMASSVLLLSGCGGGGSKATPPPPPVTSSPGYFDIINVMSGADVYDATNTSQLHIGDLQGMVAGSKFTLVSVANNLAYYATFTSLSGNNYTAKVAIYKDNAPYGNTTVSGTLVANTSLDGTFAASGTGYGRGTFKLDYSLANANAAAVSRIVRDGGAFWRNAFSTASGSTFAISTTGVLQNLTPTGMGNFSGCNISGTVSVIASTALYRVSMRLTGCTATTAANGNYTGLASSRTMTNPDDRLVVTVNNGVYSMNGEFQ